MKIAVFSTHAQFNPHATSPDILADLLKTWGKQAKIDAEQIAQQRTDIHFKETKIAVLTIRKQCITTTPSSLIAKVINKINLAALRF